MPSLKGLPLQLIQVCASFNIFPGFPLAFLTSLTSSLNRNIEESKSNLEVLSTVMWIFSFFKLFLEQINMCISEFSFKACTDPLCELTAAHYLENSELTQFPGWHGVIGWLKWLCLQADFTIMTASRKWFFIMCHVDVFKQAAVASKCCKWIVLPWIIQTVWIWIITIT